MFRSWRKSSSGNEAQYKMKQEILHSEIEGSSEVITVYVGLSIILLGTINLFKSVPPEFMAGATISGLFFAISDYILLKDKLYKTDAMWHQWSIALGVFSFFLLPVLLIMFPNLNKDIEDFTEFATFIALGLVVTSLGFKSFRSRKKFIMDMKDQINILKEQSKEVLKEQKKTEQKLIKLEEHIKGLESSNQNETKLL